MSQKTWDDIIVIGFYLFVLLLLLAIGWFYDDKGATSAGNTTGNTGNTVNNGGNSFFSHRHSLIDQLSGQP